MSYITNISISLTYYEQPMYEPYLHVHLREVCQKNIIVQMYKALWCNRCSTSFVNIFSTKKKFADLITDNGNDNLMSVSVK